MTLANVATLLAAWGQRVLVVDWDLEAPGLEQYFQAYVDDWPKASIRPGVVDLAQAAASGERLDWRECLTEARPFADRPPVSLITAGRDDGRFLARLQELDWERLFAEHDFGNHLERLRTEWLEGFDYVLVDSRTGYTDIGGICTIYLPDVLVTMFTTSWQSLRGVLSVVRRARDARDGLPFDRGHLYAVPVPGRDESRVEYEGAQEWRRVYATELAELYRDFLPTGTGAADALELLRIPYVPFWSFGERLPVVQEGTRDPSSISYYFAVLARLLASGLRWEQAVGGTGVEVTVEPTTADRVGRPPRPEPLYQLPAASADFTGRERELAELRELVTAAQAGTPAAVGIVAVDGPAGVGKSALAIQVAHEVADRFPDAQVYLNLRGAADEQVNPADGLAQVLRTLGVPAEEIPTGTEERAARYRSELAGRRALLLLDNAVDEAQVRPLLPGSPGCLVLITSRRLLASLEGARQLSLDLMPTKEAVRLLAALAGEDRVAAEPEAAVEVVRLCGHLPLAIRIAGARLRSRPRLPVSGLAGRLADEHQRLNELTVGDLGVRASFMLSYQLLAPYDARTFRRLGVLGGPDFGAGVVAALLGADPAHPEDAAETELAAEDSLEVLVDGQLVEIASEDRASGVRYYLNELLRTFAREMTARDESAEAATAALRRALEWYLHMTRQADARLGQLGSAAGDGVAEGQAALAWLEAERPNLVAAARQAAEGGWHETVWELADALLDFFDLRKHWDDWRVTSELGLAAARQAGVKAAEAGMLYSLGVVCQQTRRFQEAVDAFERSLRAFEELGDRRGEATALRCLGQVALDRRELPRAGDLFEQSLGTAAAVGDRHLEARLLRDLGTVHYELGQLDRADDLTRRSMELFRKLGDAYGEARALRNLGLVHRGLGDADRALAYLQRSLEVLRWLDDAYGAARTLTNLGIVYAEAGKLDPAIEAHEEALATYARVGDRHSIAVAHNDLGIAHGEAGRLAAAAEALERALGLFRQLGDDHDAAAALGNLAIARALLTATDPTATAPSWQPITR
jgi:tetratricopeptide (TPR) repeat protein/cellulose biosynthesis protein BcsQ